MTNQDKVRNALRDRYTFLDVLGEGAIGTVYRVQDTLTDRLVAIKVFERR
jgi:serine/threonine protein kinase